MLRTMLDTVNSRVGSIGLLRTGLLLMLILAVGAGSISAQSGQCPVSSYQKGHNLGCMTSGSCGAAGYMMFFCIQITCYVDGIEAGHGCSPSGLPWAGCMFAGCMFSWWIDACMGC